MHNLRTINPRAGLDPAPASSVAIDLARPSLPPGSTSLLSQVQILMGQLQARYPHQELDEMTVRLWMAELLEMAAQHGVSRLEGSLRAILRAAARPKFMPTPDDIREVLLAQLRTERGRQDTRGYMSKLAEWKAQWERERAEDQTINPAA